MDILSLPCIGLASVNFAVGGFYLFFYFKKPQIREYLPFALLCFSVGLYAVFCAGLYNSNSLTEGIFWQRLQLDSISTISIFLMWFTAIFIGLKDKRPFKIIMGWFLIFFFVTLFSSPELTLSTAHPAIKNLSILGTRTTYYEGAIGIVYQVEILSAIITYIYLFYLLIRFYRSTRYRSLLLVFTSLIIYFIGVVNDSLVAAQVYKSLYIAEYAFSFIVIAVAYSLLDKFVNLYTAYEEFNVDLGKKVIERTSEIERLNGHLKDLAEHDGLTGVYNRRFFNEYFEIEMKRAKSYLDHKAQLEPNDDNEMNFCLAFIDIDQFKFINDTYGHPAGDNVLKQVTEIIAGYIFSRDVLCRYGGDEFVVLLTKTSSARVLQAAEKIRKEIEDHEFVIDETHTRQHITVSIGLADFGEVPDGDSEKILKLADDRLLMAKNSGKNRIVYNMTG